VQRDRPRRDSSILRGAAQLKSAAAGGDGAVGISWLQLHDEFHQLQPNGVTDLEARALSGHATFARRLGFGGADHQFLARATATTGRDEVGRFLNDSAQRGAPFAAYTARADTFALSVEDVAWLRPTLALGAGFTVLHGRREISGRAPSPALRTSLDFDDFSPRAALLWSPDRRLSLHAAVSRGIEPPTFDDLVAVSGAHPNLTLSTRRLVPQSAVTQELGVRGTAGSFDWNLTAYRAAWRHEILRLADAAGLPRGAVNADHTRHEGLESSLHWRLLDEAQKLSLTITSTLGRFCFDGDPVYGANRLAGAPPHTGSADLLYAHPCGMFAGLEATWVAGRIPVDHANRMSYDGHTLGHVRIGWRPGSRFLVFATVRNVFDRRHIASTAGVLDLARNPAATSIFLPGPGRAFTLGLEWTP
jgi:iron complex outermembrane receptor protein